MHNQLRKVIKTRLFFAFLFILGSVTSVLVAIPQNAKAAGFTMQTGYYNGTGVAGTVISGVGFKPDYVTIRATSLNTIGVFKTSAMPAANFTYFNASAADNTTSQLTLNDDGFVLGNFANLNTANTHYIWTAIGGSDCTSTGTFCVGTYTGNAAADRDITTGFQSGIVINKRTTAVSAHFRTASMPVNQADYFTSTVNDTAGNLIKSFASTSFKVGITDNASGGIYNYIAFATTSSAAKEGSYVGDGTDNRNIDGIGIAPAWLVVKNDTSATDTSRRAVMSTDQHNGDLSSFPSDFVTDLPNYIQQLRSDGFQVGTGPGTNESASTMYWFGFAGVPPQPAGSGTYKMATGTYTGTGAAQTIAGIGFTPDLIILKDNAANYTLFRTSLMAGDRTGYLFAPASDFTAGITSTNADGFAIGTSGLVNTTGNTYHWQAFGNAYRPDTKKGAADFAVGEYYSGGSDNQNVSGVPFQMDYVAVKRLGNSAGVFRSSDQAGDLSGQFASAAESADMIQSISPTGFQTGTNAAVATVGGTTGTYRWFGFKNSANFTVGTYTGNGVVDTAISTVGFQPNLVWIKQSSTAAGVTRPATLAGDSSQYFANTINAAGKIKSLTSTGFTLGTGAETNTNGSTYRYAAWKIPVSAGVVSGDIVDSGGTTVAAPSFSMNNASFPLDCSETTGILGTSAQRIRISNTTSSATWTTSIAATDGATGLWRNSGNTKQYDYNEASGSPAGCSDGSDADSVAGKLRIEPTAGTITPQSGCSITGLSLGTNQDFNQTTTNAITLLSAASGASTNCYWDLTGVNLRQYIPENQSSDSYNINLTITTIAS